MKKRKASIKRKTAETDIAVDFVIDGSGKYKVSTGIPFLDHMLCLFAKHGVFDLALKAKGDLEIDTHHTNEDIGIVLGQALDKALGSKKSLRRFGMGFSVLDEAMARSVVDLSGRPYAEVSLPRKNMRSSGYSFSDFRHFIRSFSHSSKITLHIDVLKGEDFHHIMEVCFKSLALALDEACGWDLRKRGVPSTKGRL